MNIPEILYARFNAQPTIEELIYFLDSEIENHNVGKETLLQHEDLIDCEPMSEDEIKSVAYDLMSTYLKFINQPLNLFRIKNANQDALWYDVALTFSMEEYFANIKEPAIKACAGYKVNLGFWKSAFPKVDKSK